MPDNARQQVAELVERFHAGRDTYKSPNYNETELRIHFVNPFFRLLGWDVDNVTGRHEVFHEDRVMVDEGGRRKAKHPDYGFRLDGQVRFYVEAKKPFVNLKTDPDPAYQVRRYGWSQKLTASALTDFEEFVIYDCRVQPNEHDPAHVARLQAYDYTDYVGKWDEIYSLFARENVLNNQLDEWVRGKKARGTVEVDDAFLREMEGWRETLAKDIALHNPGLTQRQLNMAVQATIDRTVFLRICEARQIEGEGQLEDAARGGHVYDHLKVLFQRADDRYNSGLFHFKVEGQRDDPDTLTLNLDIGDDTLQTIISRLYYPTSPYEFSVLPADILGHIYERFLGKVIELTPGGGATITEKPEVRKAGGVYYTPTYIVDYIVRNTVGKLLGDGVGADPRVRPSQSTNAPLSPSLRSGEGAGGWGLTPTDAARLRILDPACGSGSFLIGAFQYLMDWHLAWYLSDDPPKHLKAKRIRLINGGVGTPFLASDLPQPITTPDVGTRRAVSEYALTTAEKKRILLNNIYGVDLDQQAVEVTKLSLLLKVLEGETATSTQMALFAERVLPDLGDNIRWGNSLIGPDFYAGKQIGLFGDEDLYRVKVFDWGSKTEGFGDIMAAGGFDAVIGNPPYIRIQTMIEWAAAAVEFYGRRYVAASRGNYDIYVIFVQKALELLNQNGRMGYILPHKFFSSKYGQPLRRLVAQGKHLAQIVHFGDQQVFIGASTYTCLLFLEKKGSDEFYFERVENLADWIKGNGSVHGYISSLNVSDSEWNFVVGDGGTLFEKLREMPRTLGEICKPFVGLQTSADTVFLFKEFQNPQNGTISVYSNEKKTWITLETDLLKPVIRSGSIGRYWARPTALVLFPYQLLNGKSRLISQHDMKTNYPLTWQYLLDNYDLLRNREHGKFDVDGWYQLYPKNLDFWEVPKIMIPYMVTRLSAYLDYSNAYFVNVTTGGFGITLDPSYGELKYFVGLLNSKLLDVFLKMIGTNFRGGYFAANKQFLDQLPIRTINFDDPADKARHDRMVALVERMLDLHQQRAAASSEQAQKTLQSLIETTDRDIDALVYDLYGLTDDEIAVVEGR